MEGIKPIETIYNGYRFRSRLEARWAVFFDALGVKWEYEPEGYDLGAGLYYLPDFVLYIDDPWFRTPKKLFIEVKGVLNEKDAQKVAVFYEGGCEAYNKRIALEEQYNKAPHPSSEAEALEAEIEKLPYYPIGMVGTIPYGNTAWDILQECVDKGYYEAEHIGWNVQYYNFETIDNDYWGWMLGISKDGKFGLFDENDVKDIDEERTMEAYKAARYARFEHGETPVVR